MKTIERKASDRKKAFLIAVRDCLGKRGLWPGEALWVPGDAGAYQDRIARAVAREREHRRVVMPERGKVLDYVFECVCCGRIRSDKERREPRSEVCLRCVQDAGFFN